MCVPLSPVGGFMHRRPVNKRKSARSFRKGSKRTHRKNISVMRGGWRL